MAAGMKNLSKTFVWILMGLLMLGLAGFGATSLTGTARSVAPITEAASDEPSADLLTQRMQIHEKNAWMLRSLLEQD